MTQSGAAASLTATDCNTRFKRRPAWQTTECEQRSHLVEKLLKVGYSVDSATIEDAAMTFEMPNPETQPVQFWQQYLAYGGNPAMLSEAKHCLIRIIENEIWRKPIYTQEDGFATFRDWYEHPLGGAVAPVSSGDKIDPMSVGQFMFRRSPEALEKFKRAYAGEVGAPVGNANGPNGRRGNGHIQSLGDPTPKRQRNQQRGREHWRARLARQYPEISARVEAGEISVHQGCILAGIRPDPNCEQDKVKRIVALGRALSPVALKAAILELDELSNASAV